ncbi:sugar phosphate nucleotidyltransferase [Oceanobacillus massiliensis]|uniref:sugar phosphate nucleotidyltransferase n=1 Tax=Oceanobacillus massiliensis TaxID=1465765 RepID=UPI0002DAD197|nr:sugar phosphate nucleotidyltransferase [Oceanobacillus massiliensis]
MSLNDLFINEHISIKEAIKKLDDTAKRILLVTTNEDTLLGIVTDGDVRRWILKNGDMSENVSLIMNKEPKFIYEKDIIHAKEILKEKMIEAIPVLNGNKQVIDIVFWNDKFNRKLNYFEKLENPVVIMAGGKGTRLEPYTKILPKPLIPIGETPIVERIINRFNEYGCSNYYMTVNYKKNMIKAHFNDIARSYSVGYVEEDNPLGTAGSLYLLKDKLQDTFFC